MSVQSEIDRIVSARDSSFDAVAEKGVTVPSGSTIDSLPSLISQIEGVGPTTSDAILTVTVPTDSTVTATKGGVTLTPTMWLKADDNTLEYALFVIGPSLFDSQNAWTVSATKDGKTVSKTVTIDSAKDYDMRLRFEHYIFLEGSGLVNGYTITANYGGGSLDVNRIYLKYSSTNTQSNFIIDQIISLANYDTLYVEFYQDGTGTNNARTSIGMSSDSTLMTKAETVGDNPNFVASYGVKGTSDVARNTVGIDISLLTGSFYLKTHCWNTNSYFYNIWLL